MTNSADRCQHLLTRPLGKAVLPPKSEVSEKSACNGPACCPAAQVSRHITRAVSDFNQMETVIVVYQVPPASSSAGLPIFVSTSLPSRSTAWVLEAGSSCDGVTVSFAVPMSDHAVESALESTLLISTSDPKTVTHARRDHLNFNATQANSPP